jgi:hypothetical protein
MGRGLFNADGHLGSQGHRGESVGEHLGKFRIANFQLDAGDAALVGDELFVAGRRLAVKLEQPPGDMAIWFLPSFSILAISGEGLPVDLLEPKTPLRGIVAENQRENRMLGGLDKVSFAVAGLMSSPLSRMARLLRTVCRWPRSARPAHSRREAYPSVYNHRAGCCSEAPRQCTDTKAAPFIRPPRCQPYNHDKSSGSRRRRR